ncbi:MAG: hypothetical protein H7Z15_21620 [Rhizobacter sp.]|nr:hypothetical protein [Rhizobacter sp.]
MQLFVLNVMVVSLLLAAQPSHAQSEKPSYGIRDPDPPTGSGIRREVVKGAVLPINKRYAELTAEEKATLNRYYERVDPGDEPPFPAEGLRPIYEAMRKGQNKLGVTGELILLATVAVDGEVIEVKSLGSPSEEMTKFAASVLFFTKFQPAVCGGKPCQMQFPFAYSFSRW